MEKSDKNTNQNRNKVFLSPDMARERIAEVFTRYVGGGGKYPAEKLRAKLGKSHVNSIYKLRSGEASPNLIDTLICCQVLGPDFATEIMAIAGFTGLRPIDATTKSMLDLNAGTSATTAKIATACVDGRIDHLEAAELAPEFRERARDLEEAADRMDEITAAGGSISVTGKLN